MSDNLKEHYKEWRTQLDDLLLEYDVPRMFWHNMTWLNSNLESLIPVMYPDFGKAIRLVHKLSPTPLTRLHSINYD